jgi:hypothetical protein
MADLRHLSHGRKGQLSTDGSTLSPSSQRHRNDRNAFSEPSWSRPRPSRPSGSRRSRRFRPTCRLSSLTFKPTHVRHCSFRPALVVVAARLIALGAAFLRSLVEPLPAKVDSLVTSLRKLQATLATLPTPESGGLSIAT